MKKLIPLIYFLSFGINAQVLQWSFETNGPIHSSPIIDDTTLFIGSGDGNFYAIDLASGITKWSYGSNSPILTDVALWNDLVIFSNEAGKLIALNKHSETLEWQFQAEAETSLDLWDYYRSSPKVSDGSVFWGNSDGNLYALDAQTGSVKWIYQTGGTIHAPVAVENKTVFIGNFKGTVFALDTETGKEKWKFQAIGSRYFPNAEFQKAPLIHEEKIYIGSRDLNLYVLDKETGRGIWHFTESGGSWIIATPLVHEGHVYFGSSDTYKFYALDENSGKEKWNIKTFTRSYGSPISYKNWVLFPGFDGKIRAVHYLSGELAWEFQTDTSTENFKNLYSQEGEFRKDLKIESAEDGERIINSLGPIVNTPVVKDDSLFFGSMDGKVYAVKLP